MNFGGHLEKIGGQNPQNSKKHGGDGKHCEYIWRKGLTHSHTMTPFDASGKQAF